MTLTRASRKACAGRIVIVGAGIAGLTAAVDLAAQGAEVVLCECAAAAGGKMRQIAIGGAQIDSGPTVFTMRWVFDALFAAAGSRLEDHLMLRRADILARHAWSESERLDLYSDVDRTADAIAAFSSPAEARRYRGFCAHAKKIYETLEKPHLLAPRPSLPQLMQRAGLRGMGGLMRIKPFHSMWKALGEHFTDPRLQQLFGRYATYCGSSPFQAPAPMMLIAHVEQAGVWLIEGGMQQLAVALAELAAARGAEIRYDRAVEEIRVENGRAAGVTLTGGERLDADAVICNADIAALAQGRFGPGAAAAVGPVPEAERSQSAVTWSMMARPRGFDLLRHNVFFSRDYAAEFEDVFTRRRLPHEPTVYVCAQDRGDGTEPVPEGPERLLCLINAPPVGDARRFDDEEIERCEERTFAAMKRCGLEIERRPQAAVVTTPDRFDRMFPATGGALYGQASHGWAATFARPGSKTKLARLYLAGGGVHPGPGVPMAALSGRLAAAALRKDLGLSAPSRPAAIAGGMSTR